MGMDVESRIESVRDAVRDAGADAFVVTGADDAFYLTGFRAPGQGDYPVVIVTPDDAVLLASPLDAATARTESAIPVTVPDDGFMDAIADAAGGDDILVTGGTRMAFEQRLADRFMVTVDTDTLGDLRAVKTDEEVACIREAYGVVEDAIGAVLPDVSPSMSERDVAAELEYVMRRSGSDGTPFPTIAATGPATAVPHHTTRDTELGTGPLLLDVGATVRGYASDMSRTVHVGQPSEEFLAVYDVVKRAQEAAADALSAGVQAATVDAAARDVITDAGYGDAFTHSTGHGVGIAVHESPNLSPRSDQELVDGMVVTIEPGIYLDDRFGVRIEDAYRVTGTGAERLTASTRDLQVIEP